jgi:hypothetical protein
VSPQEIEGATRKRKQGNCASETSAGTLNGEYYPGKPYRRLKMI